MHAPPCLALWTGAVLGAASCATPPHALPLGAGPGAMQPTQRGERAPAPSPGNRVRQGHSLRAQLNYGRVDFDEERPNDNGEPQAIGLTFSPIPRDGFIAPELGINIAWDNLGIVDALLGESEYSACELFVGARAQYDAYQIKPYVGAGGTLIYANRSQLLGFTGERSGDSLSVHPYAHVGALFGLSEGLYLSVDYRRVIGGELDFGDSGLIPESFDADSEQLSFGVAIDF